MTAGLAARLVSGAAVVLALGCSGSWLARYREAHPGWDAELPVAGQGVADVLAALRAPDGQRLHRIVASLRLLRCDALPCQAARLAAVPPVGFEPEPGADYAVSAVVFCRAETPDGPIETSRALWYWLPAGRLSGWEHVDFNERCGVRERYRPLPAARAGVEHALRALVAGRATQVVRPAAAEYQRGLRLLEAGRPADARAALARGDAVLEQRGLDPGRGPYPRSLLANALAQRSGEKIR